MRRVVFIYHSVQNPEQKYQLSSLVVHRSLERRMSEAETESCGRRHTNYLDYLAKQATNKKEKRRRRFTTYDFGCIWLIDWSSCCKALDDPCQ